MTTDMGGGPGAFRRLMNKVATWSEALNYSGIDYTLDRIAFVERELAEIKDRMRQFEASRHEPPDVFHNTSYRNIEDRPVVREPSVCPSAVIADSGRGAAVNEPDRFSQVSRARIRSEKSSLNRP
ncbi:MAG: hypothetical protein WCC25_19245 [Candidatus Korobacteraceae bacterium]